jgi:hypothetical protein
MQTLLRKIGFEVEFTAPVDPLPAIQRTLARMGRVDVQNYGHYRHSTGEVWDLKRDSSCGGYGPTSGYEVASPIIRTYEDLVKSSKIVDIIKLAGGTVNDKCGFHVHIDMNGIQTEEFIRVMRFMSRYEDAMFLLADQSRQNNNYCQKLSKSPEYGTRKSPLVEVRNYEFTTSQSWKGAWAGKHYWLNGTHLSGQGTLEFRLMASHLEAEYIVGWILFLLHSVDYLLKIKTVGWGKAKCATERDLLQTMLGQAGFYGPFNSRDKVTIVAARKWALSTYTHKVGQDDRRVKAPTITQLEALIENPTPVDPTQVSVEQAWADVNFSMPTPPRRRTPRVRRTTPPRNSGTGGTIPTVTA